MIEQGLLKKQFVGRDGFFWWLGQVVDSKKWMDNSPGLPTADLPGMKRRVKVRIMGYHTAQTDVLSDDDLPWAYCMMPVTAGGNQGGMSQSVNFSGGEWVFGFFLDGEDGQQPVVMGVLDKSSQLTFPKEIPSIGFKPFSGYTNGLVESQHNIKEDGAPSESDPTQPDISSGDGGVKVKPTLAQEGAHLESVRQDIPDHGTKAAHENAKNTGEVKPAQGCADDNPQAGIILAITRVQKQVAYLQKQQGIFLDPLSQKLGNIEEEISRAAQNVSAYMKDILDKIRGVALKEVSEELAKASIKLPIDKLGKFKDKLDEALEGLGCLFENAIKGLVGMLNSLLQDMMGKVTGALECIVNDVIGSIIDSVLGVINSIMNAITGIFDGLQNLIDAIQIPLEAVQNFLASLKALFTCQSETECQEIAQASVLSGNLAEAPGDFMGMIESALGGGGLIPEPVASVLNAAEGIRDSVTGVVDAATGLVNNAQSAASTVANAVQTVSGSVGQAAGALKQCNPFAEPCKPPLAVIFGGGTTAATANAIINQTGRIIGVDLDGSEVLNRVYNAVPSVNFKSNCGQGGGGGARAILNDDGSVQKVVMDEPGVNYPPAPDGSVGGNGGVFANADNTVIRTPDGDHQKFPPGRDVTVPTGCAIFIPVSACVVFPDGTVDQRGNDASGYQCGRGLDEGNGFIVPDGFSFRTPEQEITPGSQVDQELVYPVIMELDEINVRRCGVSYNNGDTITVSGDGNELTFEPILSSNGSILGIRIPENQRGLGFTDIPNVTINTSTGAGAQLTPYLRIKYRGRDNINEVIDQVTQDQIISVVDCVGKFNGR